MSRLMPYSVLLLSILTICVEPALGRLPTLPRLITGRPSCLQPIKYITCTRDMRSQFVAGVGTSYGQTFGVKNVCSDGGINTFLGRPSYQDTWDMSLPNATTFPKLPNGEPDLRYYSPYGAQVTQMIVLSAPNPWGDKYGTIPAIIFVYLDHDPTTNFTALGTAVCGNADYADAYLDPDNTLAAPTVVTLKAQYTNPLSAELPMRFLGSFEGKCGLLGRGWLGGDPHESSKLPLKHVYQACFAAPAKFKSVPTPPKPLQNVTFSEFNRNTPAMPCHYDKHKGKHKGASRSCIMNGYGYATGKYSLIQMDEDNMPFAFEPDETTGRMAAVATKQVFKGTHEGTAQGAPAADG